MSPYQINPHVEEMHRYIPADASFDRIYHEYVLEDRDEDAVSVRTKAEDSLLEAVRSGAGMVCLTGDAGHGKTRLCCVLLEGLGMPAARAAEAVLERGDGQHVVADLGDGRGLRIIKDLSEFDDTAAIELLVDALGGSDTVVVAANEGRLRAAIELAGAPLSAVGDALRASVTAGSFETTGEVVVLNLNYQSVASRQESLVEQLLTSWVLEPSKWEACEACDARLLCPILENRRLLAAGDSAAARRARLVELVRIAERTGAVVTIRDLLITTALAISGGLRCDDVHHRDGADPGAGNWQHDFLFHQYLFEGSVSRRLVEQSPMLAALSTLDPGRFADRRVDDLLEPRNDEDVDRFLPQSATEEIGQGMSSRESQERARSQRDLMRFIRRRQFFADPEPSAGERLGLSGYGDFVAIAEGEANEEDLIRIRESVLRGLEAVQGIRRTGPAVELTVLDPAFTRRRAPVGIEARTLAAPDAKLEPESKVWARGNEGRFVSDALDWVEQNIVLGIGEVSFKLDVPAWEFLVRAGRGLEAMSFYEASNRRLIRILTRLAAEADGSPSTVRVRTPVGRMQLVFDAGGRIQVAGA